MPLFSCANKNFLFGHLSNDCQIVRPALVSGPPNRKKPYNKHLISLVFSVRTVNYGSSFFSIDLWPKREKNSVRNLQYEPKTRLIRGIYQDKAKAVWLVKRHANENSHKIEAGWYLDVDNHVVASKLKGKQR